MMNDLTWFIASGVLIFVGMMFCLMVEAFDKSEEKK